MKMYNMNTQMLKQW